MILEGPGEGGGIAEKEESGAAAEQPVQNVELRGPSTRPTIPQEVSWGAVVEAWRTEATHKLAVSPQARAGSVSWAVSGQGLSRLTLDCRG